MTSVLAILLLASEPAPATPESELRSLAAKSTLPSLQRPNFSRYATSVRHFYEGRNYAPAWLDAGRPTPEAQALIAVLERAGAKGLDEPDYDATAWPARLQSLASGGPAALADFDLALTICLFRYSSDLEYGRAPDESERAGLRRLPPRFFLADWIATNLVHSLDAAAALSSLEPPYFAYRRTERALAEYQRLAATLPKAGAQLPIPSKSIKPGDSWPALGRVADLLRALGDLANGIDAGASVYAEPLVSAVTRFQTRHGLAPDGIIGHETVAAMNVPMTRRLRQIELALERWRWAPRTFTAPPVVVNIPEFVLRAVGDDYQVGLRMKVVVGKAYGHRTPVFAREMTHIIFRPYWEVPDTIAYKELFPKLAKDPSYFVKNHYVTNHRGPTLVRQLPGPDNALDGVKFVFPNEHDVYLHGTPATELFAKTRRDFSHGCIRVEKPAELARWVLRHQPEWTPERIAEAMNRDTPLEVRLARPIPVLIVYGTAIVRESGEVRFFNDIYHLDTALDQALSTRRP